jgi:hypothetical protein
MIVTVNDTMKRNFADDRSNVQVLIVVVAFTFVFVTAVTEKIKSAKIIKVRSYPHPSIRKGPKD